MIDTELMRLKDPKGVRAMLGDGTFGGLYHRPDEDMLAIWSVAVLGSKDTSYTRKVADSQVLYYVTGNSSEYFGTNELQDDKFYYKQSIAMLSFAAIGGQFPNVLADPKLAVGVISKPSARGSAAMDKQLFRNGTPVWRIPAAGSADAQYRNALGRAARLLP